MARPPTSNFRKPYRAPTKKRKFKPRRKIQYLLALQQPFHQKAYGARIPDTNTVPSQSCYALDTFTMDGVANGCSFLVTPEPSYIGARGTFTAANVWNWGAAFATNAIGSTSIYTSMQANYEAYRTVGHGIKITCNQPITSTAGTVHYCYGPVSVYNTVGWYAPTNLSQMQRMNGYGRVPLSSLTQTPLTIVNKPMDVTSQRYRDMVDNGFGSTVGGFDFAGQWCTIIVLIEAPQVVANLLEVQTLTHYEAIVNTNGGAIIPTGTDAEMYDPVVLGAAAHALADSELTINEDKDWDAIAVKALETFEGAMGGAVQGYGVYGVPGALAGGLYGAASGFVSRSRESKNASARRRARANATKSIPSTKRYIKY